MSKGVLIVAGKDPGAPMGADASEGSTVRIPLEALQLDSASPAVGDEVDAEISGKVISIDGDMAVVQVTSVNDKPLPDGDADDAGDESDPGADRAAAMKSFIDSQGGDNGN